jgi:hypothetical protein
LYFSFCEMLRYRTLFILGLYLGMISRYFLLLRKWTYVKNIFNQIIASTFVILLPDITVMCLLIVLQVFNGRDNKHKPETHLGV